MIPERALALEAMTARARKCELALATNDELLGALHGSTMLLLHSSAERVDETNGRMSEQALTTLVVSFAVTVAEALLDYVIDGATMNPLIDIINHTGSVN